MTPEAEVQATASQPARGPRAVFAALLGALALSVLAAAIAVGALAGGGSERGPGCPLAVPDSTIGLTVRGCTLIASDTAAGADPIPFWGRIDCASSLRHQRPILNGDLHPTAEGELQRDLAFRRLTVLDGDDVYGERCELGQNDHRVGPTSFYRHGQRRATFVSLRLPSDFPLSTTTFQVVMQMKQAQPSAGGSGVPILDLNAFRHTWWVDGQDGVRWTFPARRGVWTRFVFDVLYHRNPSKGQLQVSADLNADGDLSDARERSPRITMATLKTETAGRFPDGIKTGHPIPSHLRTGIYHHQSIACPGPTGCSVDVDNVQVLGP